MSGKAVRANPSQSAITTPIATIGIRGTMVEDDEAVAIMRGELGAGSTSKIDPKTATLVALRGLGPRSSEKRGEIDITAANRTITASNPGQAACVPEPGVAPIGPFMLSERGYRAFDSALRTVPTSVAQSQQSDSTKVGRVCLLNQAMG